MTHWLIPANPKFYDVFGAFRAAETYWPINMKVSIADTMYIYLTAPYKQIGFVCEVLDIDLDQESIFEDIQPFIKKMVNDTGQSKQFMKVKPISKIPINKDSLLGLEHLKSNGLSGMLMGARKLENNPHLLDYIKRSLP
jgi:hypothetical protein